MKREEAIKFWEFRYENARVFSDPHWEAQERREHREYVEALRMAIEALKEQEISNELQEYAYECGYEHFFHECQNCEYRRIGNKGATVQTDRPHGEWIEESVSAIGEPWQKTWYRCSECRKTEYRKTNFCPNCGARMEK